MHDAIVGDAPADHERRRDELTTPDTNRFMLATQGMVAPETFFDDENLGRIMAGAGA